MTQLNADQTVAVDPDYFWRPMRTCPRAVKVQLLNAGGVATYGTHDGKDSFWLGWAPLPKVLKTPGHKCNCLTSGPDYCLVHAP
jgi:hypothetical protein